MSQRESKEMYLLTVYMLQQKDKQARGMDVAKHLGVSKPSVTKAMSSLKKQGLVKQERYGPITLTNEGRLLAEQIYDNHNLIKKFIISSLDMSSEQAEKDACKMEHVISNEMVSAMKTYLSC